MSDTESIIMLLFQVCSKKKVLKKSKLNGIFFLDKKIRPDVIHVPYHDAPTTMLYQHHTWSSLADKPYVLLWRQTSFERNGHKCSTLFSSQHKTFHHMVWGDFGGLGCPYFIVKT